MNTNTDNNEKKTTLMTQSEAEKLRLELAEWMANNINEIKYFIRKYNYNHKNYDDLQSEFISGFILETRMNLVLKMIRLIRKDEVEGTTDAMRLYKGVIYSGIKRYKLSRLDTVELDENILYTISDEGDEEVIETICRADTLHMKQYLQSDRDKLIYDLYIVQSLSTNKVAEKLECHRNTARKYIKHMMSQLEDAWMQHSNSFKKISQI